MAESESRRSQSEEPDPRLELAYSEAVRAIAQQQTLLDTLRNRAGALFGAANIATAFLAGVALKNQDLVVESWAATICFLLVGALTIWVLLPRNNWLFETNARILVEEWIDEENRSINEMRRYLAIYMRGHYEKNQEKIDRLFSYYVAASALLGIEIAIWLYDLGRGVTH